MILAADIPTVITTLNEDLIGTVVIEIKQLPINLSPPPQKKEIVTPVGFKPMASVLALQFSS